MMERFTSSHVKSPDAGIGDSLWKEMIEIHRA